MGQLEQMMKAVLEKTIAEGFPHLKLPAIQCAVVTEARTLGDVTYDIPGLLICSDEPNGGSYRGHLTAAWQEYTLRMLDRDGNLDETFPAIPGIRSKIQVSPGAVVAVALPHGELAPAIIGEVVL